MTDYQKMKLLKVRMSSRRLNTKVSGQVGVVRCNFASYLANLYGNSHAPSQMLVEVSFADVCFPYSCLHLKQTVESTA